MNALALGLADFVGLGVALLVGTQFLQWSTLSAAMPGWGSILLLAYYCGASLLHLLPTWGLGPVEEVRRLTILLAIVFAAAFTSVALRGDLDLPTMGTIAITFGGSALLVPLGRRKMKQMLIARRLWGIPAVVYGRGESVHRIVEILRREIGLGYVPVGTYHDVITHDRQHFELALLPGVPKQVESIPVAIVSMSELGRQRTIDLLEGPLSRYRKVVVIPDLFEAPSLWVRPRDLSGVLGLEIRQNLCSPLASLLKRTVDVTAVLITAPLWLPLCVVLGALIWIEDRANPFYFQDRVGKKGRMFATCKFRTMYRDADAILKRTLESDPALEKEWSLNFKLAMDPRVTRIGRVLRRLSLDEIPQLVNVLRGDMSLVGPRPLPAYHHKSLCSRVQRLRECVRPGITGLWQVSGRSDAGSSGMEVYDPYYVRNWSLWLDAVILFRTLRVVAAADGAY